MLLFPSNTTCASVSRFEFIMKYIRIRINIHIHVYIRAGVFSRYFQIARSFDSRYSMPLLSSQNGTKNTTTTNNLNEPIALRQTSWRNSRKEIVSSPSVTADEELWIDTTRNTRTKMTNSKSSQFLRLSVLVALGLTSVASTSSIVSFEPCVDKHDSKSDCLEWAWYGEW